MERRIGGDTRTHSHTHTHTHNTHTHTHTHMHTHMQHYDKAKSSVLTIGSDWNFITHFGHIALVIGFCLMNILYRGDGFNLVIWCLKS